MVFLSTIDWDFLWQGHQEVASRFAAAGNPVIYVENMGTRSIRAADLPRLLKRLARWSSERVGTPRAPAPGVRVIAPLLIPFPRFALAREIDRRILVPHLSRRIHALDRHPSIIFTLLPTPAAVQLIHLLRAPDSILVYWCLADFSALSDLGAMLEESERALVREADLVFVQTADFAKRFASENTHIHEFQFGVNLETFTPEAGRRASRELASLPRPIIG